MSPKYNIRTPVSGCAWGLQSFEERLPFIIKCNYQEEPEQKKKKKDEEEQEHWRKIDMYIWVMIL